MSGIEPARSAKRRQAAYNIAQVLHRREQAKAYRRTSTLYPTAAYAQDAEMSLHEFEEFVFDVCFLNDVDPIARWKEVSVQQQRLVDWLAGHKRVHILGEGTDLRLSIEGRCSSTVTASATFLAGSSLRDLWRKARMALSGSMCPRRTKVMLSRGYGWYFTRGRWSRRVHGRGKRSWSRCLSWTRGHATWASSLLAIMHVCIAASEIRSSMRRWAVRCTWRLAIAIRRRVGSTSRRCTGIWCATCDATVRCGLMMYCF